MHMHTNNKLRRFSMLVKNLVVLSGLTGAGKSTLTGLLLSSDPTSSLDATTDDYPGLYSEGTDGSVIFNGMQKDDEGIPMISKAHDWNLGRVIEAMAMGTRLIVIPNTNTQRWEFQKYLEKAEQYGYRITVASLFDGGCTDEQLVERSIHGVPLPVITAMRERFEHDWKNGDTRPPWERD